MVANSHKKPMDHFHKKLLQPEALQESLETILQLLPPDAPLVITLSPVCHVRDTLVGYARSKSLLLVPIHE
jgi:hypothetical protein